MAETPSRPRRSSLTSLVVTAVIGFLGGSALMLGLYVFMPDILSRFGTQLETDIPPPQPATDRLLFEASSANLTYRAHAQGVNPGSPIYAALMSSQTTIAETYAREAAERPNRDMWVEIIFQQTAACGPFISLMRSDYVQQGVEDSETRYASTLINLENPNITQVSELFRSDIMTTGQLDMFLCGVILQAAEQMEYDEPDCRTLGLTFHDGPPMALLPSSISGKIGGIAIYLEAGRALPVEAGPLIFRIPQSGIHEYLIADYAPLFEGTPII